MPTNSFDNFYLSWTPERSKLKRPYYLTFANALEADIISGKLAAGTKLPPQRELADFLDINFTTVTQAYNLCRERNLIYGITGKGTFVSPQTEKKRIVPVWKNAVPDRTRTGQRFRSNQNADHRSQ